MARNGILWSFEMSEIRYNIEIKPLLEHKWWYSTQTNNLAYAIKLAERLAPHKRNVRIRKVVKTIVWKPKR